MARAVIIAPERRKRPSDHGSEQTGKTRGSCPFCPGNEAWTPPEILAYRPQGSKKDKPGWSLRVVPNKYPALNSNGSWESGDGKFYETVGASGTHEVIVESPDHNSTLSTLSIPALKNVLAAYGARLLDLKQDRRLRYGLVFRNHGANAGATLEHPHSQLIALPIVPQGVAAELQGCKSFYDIEGGCFFCDMMRREEESAERLVWESPTYQVLSPYASRFSFETWILPKPHMAAFEEITGAELEELAGIFSQTLKRLETVLGNPAYSLVLRTAPFGIENGLASYYHWRFEVMPRLTQFAGFELATGWFINPTAPEEAAAILRDGRPYER